MSSNVTDSSPTFFMVIRDRVSLFIDVHRLTGFRSIMIVAAMLICGFLGYLSTVIEKTWLILIVSVIPIVIYIVGLILDRTQWIPLYILLLAAFMPFSLPTGTESKLVISLVVSIMFVSFWLFKMFVIDKKPKFLPFQLNVPLFGFMFTVMISLIWGNLFRDPYVIIWPTFPIVQIASTVVMIMLPAVFLATYNHINNLNVVKAIVIAMMVAGVLGLIKMYGGIDRFPVNTSGTFNLWVIALTFSFATFNHKAPMWLRVFLLLVAIAWVVWGFVLHLDWLAGWVPGIIVIAIISFFRSRKFVVVVLTFLFIFVIFNINYFIEFALSEYQWSGVTRFAAWAQNWQISSNHWLFGTGPAGYAAYYMTYWPSQGMASHSNYIDIFSQNGIIGLFFCLWFFLGLVWYGFKLTLKFNKRFDFWESVVTAVFAGSIAVMVMMAIGDWLFPFAYTQTISGFDHAVYSWLLLALLPVIDKLMPELENEKQNAAVAEEN